MSDRRGFTSRGQRVYSSRDDQAADVVDALIERPDLLVVIAVDRGFADKIVAQLIDCGVLTSVKLGDDVVPGMFERTK